MQSSSAMKLTGIPLPSSASNRSRSPCHCDSATPAETALSASRFSAKASRFSAEPSLLDPTFRRYTARMQNGCPAGLAYTREPLCAGATGSSVGRSRRPPASSTHASAASASSVLRSKWIC